MTPEIKEKIVALLKGIQEWPKPQPGAGEGLGPLAGVGMYMQYESDTKKHSEQIQSVIDLVEAL